MTENKKRVLSFVFLAAFIALFMMTVAFSVGVTTSRLSAFAEININVKDSTDTTVTFPTLEPTDTVGDLKALVAASNELGAPAVEEQMLVFGGHLLADADTLQDYSIQNNSTVHLMLFSGQGTEADPYLIDTKYHLIKFRDIVNGSNGETQNTDAWAILTADIDLENQAWTPIGNDTDRYAGTFDGAGYTISGLNVNDSTLDNAGLFGVIDGGEGNGMAIKDLTLEGSIVGGTNTGSIAGTAYNFDILYCCNNAAVSGLKKVGGFIGYSHSGFSMRYCYNSAAVSATDSSVNFVGGIVGLNSVGEYEDCYNTGAVTASLASGQAGGIAGSMNSSGLIARCYNVGIVSGGDNGSSGSNSGVVLASYSPLRQTTEDNYYLENTALSSNGAVSGLTAAEFGDPESFNSWDFDTVWVISYDSVLSMSRPYLFHTYVKYHDKDGSGVVLRQPRTILGETGILDPVIIQDLSENPAAGKAGYTLVGWATTNGGAQAYTFNDYYYGAELDLYPVYSAIPAVAASITTQPSDPDLRYGYTSGSISVVATPDGGAEYALSYQWYSNTSESSVAGTEIVGATSDVYNIPTGYGTGSTHYYYCVVTATRQDNGETANTTSNPVTVTVNKAIPAYTLPTNLSGVYGEQLSTVVLPAQWAWQNPTYTLTPVTSVDKLYKAIFTPADTDNYEIVTTDVTVTSTKRPISVTYDSTHGINYAVYHDTDSWAALGAEMMPNEFFILIDNRVPADNVLKIVKIDFIDEEGRKIWTERETPDYDMTQLEAGTFELYVWLDDVNNYYLTAPIDLGEYAKLVVQPWTITITPNNGQGKTYGANDTTIYYSVGDAAPVLIDDASNREEIVLNSGALSRVAGENAGDYAITLGTLALTDAAVNANYELVLSETPVLYTIAPKSIAGAEITLGTALTYNGNAQMQTVSSVALDDFDLTYTVTGNIGTNAGEYILTVSGTGNFTGSETKAWSIGKKSISGAVITLGNALIYNGDEQTQEVVSVVVDDSSATYTVTENTGTDAGNYTLTVSGTGNFTGSETKAWNIGKRVVSFRNTNEGPVHFTYDENPMYLLYTFIQWGIEKFNDEEGGLFERISGTMAEGDEIVELFSAIPIRGNIDLPSLMFGEYDGYGNYTGLWTLILIDNTGNYDLSGCVFDNNFKIYIDPKPVYFTPDNAEKTYGEEDGAIALVDAYKYVYTGNNPDGPFEETISHYDNLEDLAEEINLSFIREEGEDAGEYAINNLTAVLTDIFGGHDPVNFSAVVSAPATYEIRRKDISGAEITLGAALTYNGGEQTQTVSSVTLGDFDLTYTVTDNTGTNAGDYTLTVSGTGNFTGTETKEFSIGKKVLALKNLNDAPLHVKFNMTPDYVLYQITTWHDEHWDVDLFEIVDGSLAAGDTLSTAVGYDIVRQNGTVSLLDYLDESAFTTYEGVYAGTWTIVLVSDNYAFTDNDLNANFAIIIDKREMYFDPDNAEKDYGEEDDGDITAIRISMSIHVWDSEQNEYVEQLQSLEDPEEVQTYATMANVVFIREPGEDAGEYAIHDVTATLPDFFDGHDPRNFFAAVRVPATFTIHKVDASLTSAPTAQTGLVYNGTAQALVNDGSVIGGTIKYKVGEGEWTTVATASDANLAGYTVYYQVEPDGNHNADISGTIENIVIGKKSISGAVVTLGAALTYNGNAQMQTVSSVDLDDFDLTYTVTGNIGTNAGEYILTVSGTGNFTGSETKAWSIGKKSISGAVITLGNALIYNGDEQTQEVVSVVVDDSSATYTVTENTGTDAGNYTLTVTGTGNYTGTATKEFGIGKKALTITANDKVVTYGDAPANGGVTYAGFVTGQDETILTGTLAYAFLYEQFGRAGEYDITVSGLTGDNYAITYVAGTLRVNKKAVEIGISPVVAIEGNVPDPETTITGLLNGDTATVIVRYSLGETVLTEKPTTAGAYVATAILAEANYVAESKQANFVVKATVVEAPVEDTEEDTPVSISSDDGFDPNAELVVRKLWSGDQEYKAVSDYVATNERIAGVYDVKLLLGGTPVHIDEPVTVRMRIPETMIGKEFSLVNLSGSVAERIDYTVEGDYVVITTSTLDQFAFVYAESDGAFTPDLTWLYILLGVLGGCLLIAAIIIFVLLKKKKDEEKKKALERKAGE